jgi:hypothetical protein
MIKNTTNRLEKEELELVIMNQEVMIKSLAIDKKRLGYRLEEIDKTTEDLKNKIIEEQAKLVELENAGEPEPN